VELKMLFIVCSGTSYSFTPNDLQQDRNDGDHQKGVNNRAETVSKEANCPSDDKDYSDYVKKVIHGLFLTKMSGEWHPPVIKAGGLITSFT
jgi:hypothetical protein